MCSGFRNAGSKARNESQRSGRECLPEVTRKWSVKRRRLDSGDLDRIVRTTPEFHGQSRAARKEALRCSDDLPT